MKFPSKKICINCKYHKINPEAGNVLCWHPKLNLSNNPLFRGAAAIRIRGRFETPFQEESYRKFSELCEQEGKWFEEII